LFFTKPSYSVLAQPLPKKFSASDRVYPKIPHRRRGKGHHHGGDVCELVMFGSTALSVHSYCRKSTKREFFVPARTLIAVKLLNPKLEPNFPGRTNPNQIKSNQIKQLIESNRIFIQKGMMGSWRSERVHNNRARINVNISDMIFNNAHRHFVECHVVGGVPVQLLLCCPIPVIALAGLFPG
jgi:hypothetical protein